MQALKGVIAEAPVQIGDVILADMAETGVDIIAIKEISEIYDNFTGKIWAS